MYLFALPGIWALFRYPLVVLLLSLDLVLLDLADRMLTWFDSENPILALISDDLRGLLND
jgi:hypothetical protein